jgi:complex III assembly factor LYRM7
MSLSPKARVLSAYRRLFRARKNLFAGDQRAMEESRRAIKAEFVKNKEVPTVGDHFEALMTMVDEAEDMLRHHIVRGELNQETGNYRTSF